MNMNLSMNVVFGELLTDILEFVDTRDLLHSARLVLKSWRDGATKVLLERQNLKVSFQLCEEKKYFCLRKVKMDKETSIEVTEKNPSLSDLCGLLDSPNHFPSPNFGFNDGRLNLPDALYFFSRHGDKVQSLTCDIYENKPASKDGVLQREIFKLTSNLKHLEFSGSPPFKYRPGSRRFLRHIFVRPDSSDDEEIESQDQDQHEFPVERLPRLKSIKFNSSVCNSKRLYRTFLSIRPLAPKLSTIFISHMDDKRGYKQDRYHLKILAQSTKIFTDKLTLWNNNIEVLEDIESLNLQILTLCVPASSNSQWTELRTRDPQKLSLKRIPQEFTTLLRIFENTKSSLEHLNCCVPFFLLFKKMEKSCVQSKIHSGVDSTFTNFPKWNSLELDFEGSENKFNSDSDNYAELPSCFKEIRNMVLKFPEDGTDSLEEFFNLQNSNLNLNSNVTSVSIHKKTEMCSEILEKIVKCFPSLKKLTFDDDAKETQSNHDDDNQPNLYVETSLSPFKTDL